MDPADPDVPPALTSPPPHMTPEEFREHGRAVIDWIADYWERIESLPVASTVQPGDIRELLPEALQGAQWYTPTDQGFEKTVAARLAWWAELKKSAR